MWTAINCPYLEGNNFLGLGPWTWGKLVIAFAFVTGVHFNSENIIRGIW